LKRTKSSRNVVVSHRYKGSRRCESVNEYCKLDSEDKNEEEYMEDKYELCCQEDFEEELEELSVLDLAPEGMGYEYFSDDEYLGDVG
tara:strand:+ start:187 stop:447 length:261 start_codon:yes stop_codon:yes gene_type:complete